jgi:hypothetical protein
MDAVMFIYKELDNIIKHFISLEISFVHIDQFLNESKTRLSFLMELKVFFIIN